MKIVICGLSMTSSWGNGPATTYRSLVKELSRIGASTRFKWACHTSPPQIPEEFAVDALKRYA